MCYISLLFNEHMITRILSTAYQRNYTANIFVELNNQRLSSVNKEISEWHLLDLLNSDLTENEGKHSGYIKRNFKVSFDLS